MNTINSESATQIGDWLKARQRPLLVSHRKPDGDALGSLAAMTQVLTGWSITPTVALFDPIPARYSSLTASVQWQAWESVRESWDQFDALVVLDTSSQSQLEPIRDLIGTAPPLLVIDHHATAETLRAGTEDLKICDPGAAATCVLLAEWVLELGEPLGVDLAAALFIGIATDTGWFRYSNADTRTYRLAAELVAAGVNPAPLNRTLYERDALGRLRLQGRVLETMEVRCAGKLAVLRLRQSDFVACQADMSMTEDLVNAPGTLDGLEATVMFTEQEDGIVRVNFRSKELVDVGALAAHFGGGGHARASGARISASWEDATLRVIAAIESALAGC